MKKILYYLSFTLIIILALEVLLRLLGYSTYDSPTIDLQSNFKDRFKIIDSMGADLIPGRFESIYKTGKKISTHTEEHSRLTFKMDNDTLPKIFLMGCSFTYGYSLNDKETYPYLADSVLKNYNILNYGVPGSGTLQTLIKLRNLLKAGKVSKPTAVVLNYLNFHDERNSLNNEYQTKLLNGYRIIKSDRINRTDFQAKFPFIRPTDSTHKVSYISFGEMENNEFPFKRQSALANKISNIRDNLNRDEASEKKLSCYLLGEINQLCLSNGIRFYVSFMEEEKDLGTILGYCKEKKIHTFNLSMDFTDKSNFNLPNDAYHPSFKANRLFAQKLIASLAKENIQ